mmetsp:Transcript_29542/g.45009  ORF Transcript_29542/g.45009 Transcript_29542/m.45009 type:complete len:92 (+) Transcript_29542:702-977(+)
MIGVECGDMGPKLGLNMKDNGWLTLHQVRIPRSHLLCRFKTVSPDGTFSKTGDVRYMYAVILKGRVGVAAAQKWVMLQALTITLRYSVVRR